MLLPPSRAPHRATMLDLSSQQPDCGLHAHPAISDAMHFDQLYMTATKPEPGLSVSEHLSHGLCFLHPQVGTSYEWEKTTQHPLPPGAHLDHPAAALAHREISHAACIVPRRQLLLQAAHEWS